MFVQRGVRPTSHAGDSQSQAPPAASRKSTCLVPPPNQKHRFSNPKGGTPWDFCPRSGKARPQFGLAGLWVRTARGKKKIPLTSITHTRTQYFPNDLSFISTSQPCLQPHQLSIFDATENLCSSVDTQLTARTCSPSSPAQILAPIVASQQSRQSKETSLQQSLLDR